MKDLKQYIEELTNLQGNVGYEDEVIDYVMNELEEHSDNLTIDTLGNITLHLTPENTSKPKVMIFGHMDEVGMMVKRIDDYGFLKLEKLGSISAPSLPGTRVSIEGKHGKVNGVIGVKSHHLSKDDKQEQLSVQSIYVDIGAKDKESALKAGVEVGNPVAVIPQFLELLDNCVSNKSMDDRALLAIMMYLIKNLDVSKLNVDLYLVFSVQEEFSIRGIIPTSRQIKPDIVIGLDVTPATDTPELRGFSEISVGDGPAFTYMQHHGRTLAGIVVNKQFLNYLENIASENDIQYQREVATGILTETAYISIDNTECAVANISLPTRYTHTPVEIVSLDDCHSIYSLLTSFLYKVDETTKFGKDVDYYKRKKRGI